MRRLSILIVCLGAWGALAAQFTGGRAGGYRTEQLSGVGLGGNILAATPLFCGGSAAGFGSSRASVTLSVPLAAFVGGRAAGYELATTSSSLADPLALFLGGGAQDGYARVTTSTPLAGAPLLLFAGGSGNGYARGVAAQSSLVADLSVLFTGGDNDGYALVRSTGITLADDLLPLFVGGDNDGYASERHSATLVGEALAALFSGGNDDGYTMGTTQEFLIGVLPVEWISFTAEQQGKAVLLRWSTAHEVANDRFEVERSPDGITFRPIATVLGSGTSDVPQHYSELDERPDRGTNFYRIKQLDFGGQFSYTDIRSVRFAEEDFAVTIYPNPNHSRRLNLAVAGLASDQELSVRVYSMQGQLLLLDRGSSTAPITLDGDWPAGNYRVVVTDGKRSVSKNLVIID
ncbi:MAG: T9SS type A sorting domain-containing protein [Bacteroidota bacterium]